MNAAESLKKAIGDILLDAVGGGKYTGWGTVESIMYSLVDAFFIGKWQTGDPPADKLLLLETEDGDYVIAFWDGQAWRRTETHVLAYRRDYVKRWLVLP